ncbi:major facilitator superfamily domain-containing protein [Penicillium lagena]|uniref:major facilitator superfamily domain-containing protein n=1 Tax=Penicillium lagena TaxID=94218 RepID=UPI00253FF9E9|nr:major facilitator superfamily domain-containing protein [Penicillium lagena]KAJ5613395.1 major facilitator superfamily domain-containing protein [Penicillium lagena]
MSPAHSEFERDFHVSSTVALLPLSLYSLALGFGPVLGGPLSETIGRYPVYLWGTPLGALFTLGAGLSSTFPGICILRFLAGLFWAPSLAVATGSIVETFKPRRRGQMVALYILMPFLGPGCGQTFDRRLRGQPKGLALDAMDVDFFAIFSFITVLMNQETYHPVIQHRLNKERPCYDEQKTFKSRSDRFKSFIRISLIRPLHMLVAEPIVALLCLYIAAEFGTLFSFFAAVPYTFGTVYQFSLEQEGLVFASIIIGCFLALLTILLCDIFIYNRQTTQNQASSVAPEHRLYAAMMGSIGLPIGLFWYAWTARSSISWASPAAAIIVFAWGNLCIFVSAFQYMADTYRGSVIASAASANSLARYTFAAVFPLFTIQMYERLGIHWASSLLGFIALTLMPIPWLLFRFGPRIRAKSLYESL